MINFTTQQISILQEGPGTILLKNGDKIYFDFGDYKAPYKEIINVTIWDGSMMCGSEIPIHDIVDVWF